MTDTDVAEILPTKPKRKSRRPKAVPKPVVKPAHGTRARYGLKSDPCRCSLCKAANAKWQQDYRDSKKTGRKRIRKTAIHGTRAKYVAKCRCKECTEANRDYQRELAQIYRAGGSAKDLVPADVSDLD